MTDIEIPTARGPLSGHLAVPDGDGPFPAVVVLHEALGLTADIRRIADRFAAEGYLAVAPALFSRGRTPACIVGAFRSLATGRGPVVEDITDVATFLRDDPRTTGRVGAAGFCMGGGFCLLFAGRDVFDAIAPNYGVFPPATGVPTRSCPVVASYGGKDRMLPGAAAKLEAALAPTGVARDIKEYPEVGHSFLNRWPTPAPLRVVERIAGMAYSRPEAEDAWDRIVDFFGEHLR